MNRSRVNLSRRKFVSSLGLTMTACALPLPVFAKRTLPHGAILLGARPQDSVLMEAKTGQVELLGKGLGKTDIWGYGGSVPGPVLRVKQGRRAESQVQEQSRSGIDHPLAWYPH